MSEELISGIVEAYGFAPEIVREAVTAVGETIEDILDYIELHQTSKPSNADTSGAPFSEPVPLAGSNAADNTLSNAPSSASSKQQLIEDIKARQRKLELEKMKREKEHERNMKMQIHDRIRFELEARKHESEMLRKRMQQQYAEMRAAKQSDAVLGNAEDALVPQDEEKDDDVAAATVQSGQWTRGGSDLQTVAVVPGTIKVKAVAASSVPPRQTTIRTDKTMGDLFAALELAPNESIWIPSTGAIYSCDNLDGRTLEEHGFTSNMLVRIK